MLKAYQECFLLLTKTYYQSGSKKLVKFLAFTYKELLKTYLGGRLSGNAINVKFFQSVFEQNPGFGWEHLLKLILKCIVSTKAPAEKKPDQEEDIMMKAETGKSSKKKSESEDGDGARSNHQRLQAVELLGHLIKECSQHKDSRKHLADSLTLLCSVIVRSIQTADSWKNKKVTKTIQVVNLYIKAAKILSQKDKEGSIHIIREQGALIIKAIEAECQRDKAMSNLKGKVKEIKAIIEMA